MQVARPSSSTKKLAKINMPSILSQLGKASKVKTFELKMDNYHDVQRPKVDNMVSKVVALFKISSFEWWTRNKTHEPKVVASLTRVGFMKLFMKRFTPPYQELLEGMNLMQM